MVDNRIRDELNELLENYDKFDQKKQALERVYINLGDFLMYHSQNILYVCDNIDFVFNKSLNLDNSLDEKFEELKNVEQ